MSTSTLIGRVAARLLAAQMPDGSEESGSTARFIIDCLTGEQTAAIARAVLAENYLASQVEIRLPVGLVRGQDLPESILTTERTTFFRNAPCEKPILLVANTGDDEEQSLKELVPIGAAQLQDRPDLWVAIAAEGLSLTSEHLKWWEKALTGIRELRLFSLERVADYILRTRRAIEEEGLPIIPALGNSLPALHIPKDSAYFNALNGKTAGHASKWKRLLESAQKKRACFLQKQTPALALLSEDELLDTFEKVKDNIPDAIHGTVKSFIAAPAGWNEGAARLAECEWESIAPLFDGFKREAFNLGQATLDFYDERENDLITEDERDYLRRLIRRKTSGSEEEEDRGFFENHRNELKEERKLKLAWDRFIFGKPLETDDLLAGLVLCLERLFGQETPKHERRLGIRCERATKKDLRDLNVEAGLYFAKRYKGLRALFGKKVKWDVGHLFDFPELVQSWRDARKPLNYSASRAALQLKFVLELEVDVAPGRTEVSATQLIWKFAAQALAAGFAQDWSRLEEHPLVFCTTQRRRLGAKAQFQTVDLSNVQSFVPAFGKERGSFVGVYKKSDDIEAAWRKHLEEAQNRNFVSAESGQALVGLFDAFLRTYTSAIHAFGTGDGANGLASSSLVEQAQAYAALLEFVCREAKGDRNRELLLRPLLQIGVIAVVGGQPSAITAPWQPLRLAATAVKAHLVASLMKRLLEPAPVEFGDARLFFRDLHEALRHPFYPEIVLGWHEQQPGLLILTDTMGDYSLHESPVVTNDGQDDMNENPTDAANCVVNLVRRYLGLHPHEHANLAIVLYNCDSARLPQAVVEKIAATYDDDEEVRCQIILRHRDATRLRLLYERILSVSDEDPDVYSASEATRDFMARLRIGIMADQAPVPSGDGGRPTDIVFSEDVIARQARLGWYREGAKPVPMDRLVPAHWSRRRPTGLDDLKSVVYLCSPAQSSEGWAFLTALTTFVEGDWDGDTKTRLLPARQLDFRDTTTARIFDETHNLGNWVVNYDELLDRRQLLNHDVRVIRYKQVATQGRNIIISSKAPLGLLRSMVLGRLRDLNLGLEDSGYLALADQFLEDAKEISGDIVLRAAKHGRNASELLGIVLSRFLLSHELGPDAILGWYFLDDYSDWLGQREEQIADILALSPEEGTDGSLRLTVLVAEAKYIDEGSLASKRKESQRQLRETVSRVTDAVFGNPERLDRTLWLARLSDLILDGVLVSGSKGAKLTEWRRAIRDGECEIFVRGYSHIFVSSPSDATDCSDFVDVANLENGFQEIFSRRQLKEIVLRYLAKQNPSSIREENAGNEFWTKRVYRRPSDLKSITITVPARTTTAEPSREGHAAQVSPVVAEERSAEGSGQSEAAVEIAAAGRGVGSRWAYPGIEGRLLSSSDSLAESAQDREWLKDIGNRTKGALQQFQLQSKLVESVLTPNSALLRFAGSANLTVEQVLKRRSEFLTTHGINIISVSPAPGLVCIAVERPHRQLVRIQDVWKRWTPNSVLGNQELLIGIREDNGELLCISPGERHAPHTLVAGSTGSGKSVLLQNLLLAIAATNTPRDARIILIDPKQGVDYVQFEGLPHLQSGLIDDQALALVRLQALVGEMDRRYTLFKGTRTNSLGAYNRKVLEKERLPVQWVFHDEFAEWMLVEDYKENVTALVSRLGVKARAAGIHLVFAAQRPDANVMPMQLRANLGNRLILRVDSEGTSEIALGDAGAERLLGRGHMLAKLEGFPLVYAQVPYVEPDFIDEVVRLIRDSEGREEEPA
jgi:DNA segregation ATPase FtsK/SpoIIIE, S-DNA-T family